MIGVKICGITVLAMLIVLPNSEAMPSASFFIRKAEGYQPERAREIIQKIPGSIEGRGLCQSGDTGGEGIVSFCGLRLIQTPRDESFPYCAQFARSSLIKTVSDCTEEESKNWRITP